MPPLPLHKFQIEDLGFYIHRGPRTANLSDPGVGKTPSVCVYQDYLWAEHNTKTAYPDMKLWLNAVLKSERLPFDVVTGTSESGAQRRDKRDVVLGDSSLFMGLYREVKRADTSLAYLALFTEQNDQIVRYSPTA